MEESLEYSSPLTWESFYSPMSAAVEQQLFPDAVNRLAPTFLNISKLTSLPTPEQLGFTWTGDLSPSQNQAFASLWNLKNRHPNEYWAGLRQLSAEQRFIMQFPLDYPVADTYLIGIIKKAGELFRTYVEPVQVPEFQAELQQTIKNDPKFTNLKSDQKILLSYIATANLARKATFTRHF